MTVKDLSQKLSLSALAGGDGIENEVKGCHIGDLLSVVMSRAQEGDVWITIQGNINVPAVASLTECAMVIIAEGMKLEEAARARFESEGIPVYASEESAYSLACKIKECL